MPAPIILAPPEKIRRLAELRARLKEQEAERRRAEGPRWATPGDLARAIDPATVQTPALDLIDDADRLGVRDADTTEDAKRVYDAMKASGCRAADLCALHEACPFYVGCLIDEEGGIAERGR